MRKTIPIRVLGRCSGKSQAGVTKREFEFSVESDMCPVPARSKVLQLVQIYRNAAALLYALNAFLLGGRLLVRTVQCECHCGEALGFAERARLEGTFLSADMSGDVEGVALSVAKAVNDGPTHASLLVDGLLQWLRLAPVALQILALGDVKRFLAGLQNLIGWRGRAVPLAGAGARGRRVRLLLRFVWVVLVRMRDGAL